MVASLLFSGRTRPKDNAMNEYVVYISYRIEGGTHPYYGDMKRYITAKNAREAKRIAKAQQTGSFRYIREMYGYVKKCSIENMEVRLLGQQLTLGGDENATPTC